jgi:Hydrazine synthase alpha subunit middle domain
VQRTRLGIAVTLALAAAAPVGCGGSSSGPLDHIDALIFLQRPKRNETGDIFQYTSYKATARIVKLSPPTADGTLTTLCCDQAGDQFKNVDINSYDLSYDATQVVFSGKLSDAQHYGLFLLTLADGKVQQLPTDPNRDYVYPAILPGDKILFMTNAVVEPGAPQHRDEYERGLTTQVGSLSLGDMKEDLGARNLSHRAFPSVLSDGRVIFTEWNHLGDTNEGDLRIINPDMEAVREGFGREGTGLCNSYLKAREISKGRVLGICTSRDRTVQAGAMIDIRLGKTYEDGGNVYADHEMSEANASYKLLTPDVPLGGDPSSPTVGRYYDAWPLDAKDSPNIIVSWADGPVESRALAEAGLSADFGIYLFDSAHNARHPIFNDPEMWDIFARPLAPRSAPPEIPANPANGISNDQTLIGSMDVSVSTLFTLNKADIYGVRVMEGYSSEEGFMENFGNTHQEGHTQLTVAPMQPDGSWAAMVPANVPIHLQVINRFGMAIATEPVWFSGRRGESRFCEGCHGSRSKTTIIQPGITQALARGPDNGMAATPRKDRVNTDYTIAPPATAPVPAGMAWDKGVQPSLDACATCHNGVAGPGNPSYTLTDPATGQTATWVFNLKGDKVDLKVGNFMLEGYSASYLSLVGPDMEAIAKAHIMITGDLKIYMKALDALHSPLMEKLNPPVQYPTPDLATRAFPIATHPPHAPAVLGHDLQPIEYLRHIKAADKGANFYARENRTSNPYPN